jgi:PAS domain S-box-containing protein
MDTKPMENSDSLTILLVEDQLLIAELERIALETEGYAVKHILNGESAIDYVRDAQNRIDLILMDIDLGEGMMNGTEAAIQIQKLREIPILFLSSHTEQSILEMTASISAYGYVVKNSPTIVLDNAIKMAIRLFKVKQDHFSQKKEYEDLYNNSPCGYHSIDSTGNITKINETLLKLLGYSSEEVLTKIKISDIIHFQNSLIEIEDFLKRLYNSSIRNLEVFYIKKDKTLLPVLFNSDVLLNTVDDSSLVRAIVSDNSQKLISDYQLKKSNYELEVHQIELEMQNEELRLRIQNNKLTSSKYSFLFKDSPLGYISLDKFGKIIELNNSCAKIFRTEKHLLIGEMIQPLLMVNYKNSFDKFLNLVFSEEFNISCDFQIQLGHLSTQFINLRKINVSEGDQCYLLIFDINDLIKSEKQISIIQEKIA